MRILFGLPLLAGAVLIIWAAAVFAARRPKGGPEGEYRFVQWVTASIRNTVAGVVVVMALATLVLLLFTGRPVSSGELGIASYAMFAAIVIAMMYLMAFRLWHTRWKYAVLAAFVFAATAWVMWPNWFTLDALAVLLALSFLVSSVGASISFRFAITASGAMFLYDIVHVYITGWMQGLITPTHQDQVPLALIVPDRLSFEAGTANLLGLGDVLVPGFMVMTAAVLAYRRGVMSLLYCGLAGYAVGLSLAGLLLIVFNQLQPALITLYPCTLAGILLAAWRAGVVRALFEQRHMPRPTRYS